MTTNDAIKATRDAEAAILVIIRDLQAKTELFVRQIDVEKAHRIDRTAGEIVEVRLEMVLPK